MARAVQKLSLKSKPKKSKKKNTVRGRGDYLVDQWTDVSPRRNLGSVVGSKIGGLLGNAAESTLRSMVSGCGDYSITANTLLPQATKGGADPPEFSKSGRRGVRIREREYICDVISGTANTFNNQSFRINPADPTTFPWLTSIAQQFEEYQVNGMIFEYRSTSSAFNGTGQSLGTVVLATDYDALDTAATSKLQLENYDYANSCSTNESAMHGIECARNETPFPVLYCSVFPPQSGDKKTFDLGNFQVATFGVNTNNVNLGELWVSYDITFYKKQIEAGQIGLTNPTCFVVADTSTWTNTNVFGNRPQIIGNLPFTVSGNVIYFPPTWSNGYYMLRWEVKASTTATPNAAAIVATNCNIGSGTSNYWSQLPSASGFPGVGFSDYEGYTNGFWSLGISTEFAYAYFVHITAQNAYLTFNAMSALNGGLYGVVTITQVAPPATMPSAVLGT